MIIEVGDLQLQPQRIFCIGVNYAAHQIEMGKEEWDRCVIFMKPFSSLVPVATPVLLPRDRGIIHHEVELVVAIGKQGGAIPAGRAREHIAGITIGLDLTLRELQKKLKNAGHPWERSKAFENSAPIGRFVPLTDDIKLDNIDLTCSVNGEIRQQGNTEKMLFGVEQLIEILSNEWTLRPGDLIFTGTPEGVSQVKVGDRATISSSVIGEFGWDFV